MRYRARHLISLLPEIAVLLLGHIRDKAEGGQGQNSEPVEKWEDRKPSPQNPPEAVMQRWRC